MVSALVLVNTNIGQEEETLANLKAIKGVEEAHALWGVYDLMIKVKATSMDELKDLVHFQLREAGANTLLTLMMVDRPT